MSGKQFDFDASRSPRWTTALFQVSAPTCPWANSLCFVRALRGVVSALAVRGRFRKALLTDTSSADILLAVMEPGEGGIDQCHEDSKT